MPEGHTIHRLAAAHTRLLAGRAVRASSPQGTFTAGAALLDGEVPRGAEAHGKHLFVDFSDTVGWLHVHLGLFGKYRTGEGDPPEPFGALRLRLAGPGGWADLRGPTACQVITDAEKAALHARLGPDPLRPGTDPGPAGARIARSRTPIATLLMDQKVVAGVGNVYRAEVLFRHGTDPYTPGRDLPPGAWDAMWTDLVALMREGVRHGRIDTVRPEHTPEAMGRPPRTDGHGGEVYVYRRTGAPCLVCGTPVRTAVLGARNLFWCPACQKPWNG